VTPFEELNWKKNIYLIIKQQLDENLFVLLVDLVVIQSVFQFVEN